MNRHIRRRLQKETRTANHPEVNATIKRMENTIQTQRALIERLEQENRTLRAEQNGHHASNA